MLQSRLAGCCLGHFNANLFAAFAHRACRAYVCVVTALAPPLIISYPHMWIASCVRTCSSLDAFDWSRWVALTNRTIEANLISTSLHFAASARSYCISLLFDLRLIARLPRRHHPHIKKRFSICMACKISRLAGDSLHKATRVCVSRGIAGDVRFRSSAVAGSSWRFDVWYTANSFPFRKWWLQDYTTTFLRTPDFRVTVFSLCY